jgi:hypothetical protein
MGGGGPGTSSTVADQAPITEERRAFQMEKRKHLKNGNKGCERQFLSFLLSKDTTFSTLHFFEPIKKNKNISFF